RSDVMAYYPRSLRDGQSNWGHSRYKALRVARAKVNGFEDPAQVPQIRIRLGKLPAFGARDPRRDTPAPKFRGKEGKPPFEFLSDGRPSDVPTPAIRMAHL